VLIVLIVAQYLAVRGNESYQTKEVTKEVLNSFALAYTIAY